MHGALPGEVKEDLEGQQIARLLGKNMAWSLKLNQLAKEQNLIAPEREAKVRTNFVR